MSNKPAQKHKCLKCDTMFSAPGGKPVCLVCDEQVNASIREGILQGVASSALALRLGLSLSNVKNRAYHIRQELQGNPAPQVVALPRKPKGPCLWPSGDPAREMHVCCQVPAEIACCSVDAA